VTTCLQDGSEEIVSLAHTCKGKPVIEWTKDFVQSQKKDIRKSIALIPSTRIQVADDESKTFSNWIRS